MSRAFNQPRAVTSSSLAAGLKQIPPTQDITPIIFNFFSELPFFIGEVVQIDLLDGEGVCGFHPDSVVHHEFC